MQNYNYFKLNKRMATADLICAADTFSDNHTFFCVTAGKRKGVGVPSSQDIKI